jgi:hypothetical protein
VGSWILNDLLTTNWPVLFPSDGVLNSWHKVVHLGLAPATECVFITTASYMLGQKRFSKCFGSFKLQAELQNVLIHYEFFDHPYRKCSKRTKWIHNGKFNLSIHPFTYFISEALQQISLTFCIGGQHWKLLRTFYFGLNLLNLLIYFNDHLTYESKYIFGYILLSICLRGKCLSKSCRHPYTLYLI